MADTKTLAPGQVDTEAGLDADEIMQRFEDSGHAYGPDKQRLRMELAGQKVTLYRMLDGKAVLLNADQTDTYLAKPNGAFAAKKPSAAKIREWRKDNGYEDIHLAGVDNDDQPGDQVDPEDKFSEPKTRATRAARAQAAPQDQQPTTVTPPAGTAGSGITTSEDLSPRK